MADGSIVLETKVDDSGVNKGLSKIKSGAAKLGKVFAVAGGAATAAFTAISKAAVDSYADYEQLTGGVETLFKTNSSVVMDYANQAYKTAGMSANQYMETVTGFSASLLQSLGGDTAKAAEYGNQAVIDMSDNANKMGTSMEAIQNAYQGFAKQNYTMLDNLKLGYGGTKTEMERLLKDAEAIKLANGEMASYSIESFADITEAIHVVQTEMGITGTTAEEAATTIQGSVGMMKAAWENLLTGLADSNADVNELMNEFIESVETVFENLEPVIEETLENLPDLVTKIGTTFITTFPEIFKQVAPKAIESLSELIKAIVETISKNADTIADTVIEIGKILVKSIVELTPAMVNAGSELIKGLIKGISAKMPALSNAAVSITAVFAAIKITGFVQNIVSGFQKINSVLNAYTIAVAANQNVSTLLASTMTPLQLAIGVLTGKVELATIAHAAWNAVKSIDPVYWIVAGVAALTAAVVGVVIAYNNYLEKNSELVRATKEMAEQAEEAVEKADSLNESISKLGETAEETIENANAEAYANSALADELYDLAEQTDLTAEQKERMQDIVGELNDSVDGLNLQLDEETGQLNMTRDALGEYITKSLEVAKATAVQDMYTDTLKETYKAQAEATNNAKKLKEAQDQLNELTEKGTWLSGEDKKAKENLEKAIEEYSAALSANKSSVISAQENMEALADVTGVKLPEAWEENKIKTQGYFDTLESATGKASEESNSLGGDFATGYGNGISDKNSEIYQKGVELAQQALKGVKDGQRSASPAKETIVLGRYFDDGYIKGIVGKFRAVNAAGTELAKVAIEGTVSGAKKLKEHVKKTFKSLTEDTRSEVQKVVDKANEKLLESEVKYNEEKERLETDEVKAAEENNKQLEESNKKYLEELKNTAEKEREIYDARQKDLENLKENIVNTYSDIAEEALDSIEELEKTQSSFAKKLSEFGGLTETVKLKNGKEKTVLSDIDEQTDFLENYEKSLLKIKELENVPADFFEMIRDMSIQEGADYANALLNLSDKDFQEYIAKWKRKQEVSQKISKELYSDEARELANEINGEFDTVENEFFGVGSTAADNFESGFMSQLKGVIKNIKDTINSAFSSVAIPTESYGMSFKVPALARGAVIPANREFLAVLGDQKHGTNIEAPLATIQEALALELDKRQNYNNSSSVGDIIIPLQINEREFGRAVIKSGDLEKARTGNSFVRTTMSLGR